VITTTLTLTLSLTLSNPYLKIYFSDERGGFRYALADTADRIVPYGKLMSIFNLLPFPAN
jgi:hypothetical protein